MIGYLIGKRKAREGYELLARHEFDAFLKPWSDDAVFVYPGDVRLSGIHSGKQAIRDFFQQWGKQFPTVRFDVKHVTASNPLDFLGNNVMTVHWDVSATSRDGFEAQTSGISLIFIRRGAIVRVQDFIFDTGDMFRRAWGEPTRFPG